MPLNLRKSRFARRMVGYATNPVKVRARVALGRDQEYEIGGVPVVLPPDHNLPFYQRRDPTYDAYAERLVAAIDASSDARVTVVDLGANVGDTAVAMLSTGPDVQVVAIEGSSRFTSYLRRNVAPFGDRVRVVERFVGPVGVAVGFSEENGTGGFQAREGTEVVTDWITPAEVLAAVPADDLVVWKSDVDGFDIHILAEHWAAIDTRCEVLWFEFDPAGTLGDKADVERLTTLLGESGRELHVYDNLGRPMVTLAPGEPVRRGLTDLAGWLVAQRHGHVTTPYLDVWAVPPALGPVLDAARQNG